MPAYFTVRNRLARLDGLNGYLDGCYARDHQEGTVELHSDTANPVRLGVLARLHRLGPANVGRWWTS